MLNITNREFDPKIWNQIREILNITRIFSINDPIDPNSKDSIKDSLLFMASRAERKYNDGFKGIVRKVIALFFNLFATDSVSLFGMNNTDIAIRVVQDGPKLPWFIGNNANFARLINETNFA